MLLHLLLGSHRPLSLWASVALFSGTLTVGTLLSASIIYWRVSSVLLIDNIKLASHLPQQSYWEDCGGSNDMLYEAVWRGQPGKIPSAWDMANGPCVLKVVKSACTVQRTSWGFEGKIQVVIKSDTSKGCGSCDVSVFTALLNLGCVKGGSCPNAFMAWISNANSSTRSPYSPTPPPISLHRTYREPLYTRGSLDRKCINQRQAKPEQPLSCCEQRGQDSIQSNLSTHTQTPPDDHITLQICDDKLVPRLYTDRGTGVLLEVALPEEGVTAEVGNSMSMQLMTVQHSLISNHLRQQLKITKRINRFWEWGVMVVAPIICGTTFLASLTKLVQAAVLFGPAIAFTNSSQGRNYYLTPAQAESLQWLGVRS